MGAAGPALGRAESGWCDRIPAGAGMTVGQPALRLGPARWGAAGPIFGWAVGRRRLVRAAGSVLGFCD